MSGIQYPVDIKDIGKFEHQNNISVNVYGYEDKKNIPVTYYYHDHCKGSRKFIIRHCCQNISLCIFFYSLFKVDIQKHVIVISLVTIY